MMKQLITALGICVLLSSCATANSRFSSNSEAVDYLPNEEPITQSLFNDKNASISEEGIQKILAGTYTLPPKLRVAMVQLDNQTRPRRYYWNEEPYLKAQQAYLDLFTNTFKQSPRVVSVASIPALLVAQSPSFTSIREAAVRMQADVVVVYSISSDIYAKYRAFASPNIKAFATTQLLVLDVRTGLIPFSAISTKDTVSQKTKGEMDNAEAATRIKNEAVLLTISDIGGRISTFLAK
jgi:PBP1b-binding outer membrane lipoprotein LpoB